MSENTGGVSRRDLLLTVTAAGLDAEAAQHAHHAVTQEKAGGPYAPKFFKAHEYRTLAMLSELILPGAGSAGVHEFIDFLASRSDELAAIFTGGLAWLDAEMKRRCGRAFADAGSEQQTALLDQIAWRKNDSPQLGPGIRFFEWARKMTVDAYYTTKAGVEELGFQGNGAMSEFRVPAQAIEYALKRSESG